MRWLNGPQARQLAADGQSEEARQALLNEGSPAESGGDTGAKHVLRASKTKKWDPATAQRERAMDEIRKMVRVDAEWIAFEIAGMYPGLAQRMNALDQEREEEEDAEPAQGDAAPEGGQADSNAHEDDTTLEVGKQVPVVQFANCRYFGTEDDPIIPVEVIRIGSCAERTVVSYATKDISCVAGDGYKAASGTLAFEPGETMKTIELELLVGDEWKTTEEFELTLLKEGLQGACLGKYLYRAQVFRIDLDQFPSSTYSQEDKDTVSMHAYMMEYMKMNWRNPVVRRRTIMLVLTDGLRHLLDMLALVLQVYLVDHVLDPEGELWICNERHFSLMLVSGITVASHGATHLLDYFQLDIGVGGASRMMLQESLVRKYVNYTEASRTKLSVGDLTMAVTRDAPLVAKHGYKFIIDLIRALGSLVVMAAFIFLSPIVFQHKEINGWALASRFGIMLIFPTVLLIVLDQRRSVNKKYLDGVHKADITLTDSAQDVTENFILARDYDMREKQVEFIQKCVKAFNGANRAKNKTLLNSAYCAPWLAVLIVGVYMPLRGLAVIDGSLKLGMFLANLKIIGRVGKAWGQIYKLLLARQTAFPCLEGVMRLLNLETDGATLMGLTRKLTRNTLDNVYPGGKPPPNGVMAFDNQPIVLANLVHDYASPPRPNVRINIMGKLVASQGRLTCIWGPTGQGKSTVLRLLSMQIAPSMDAPGSEYYLPSHLRCLRIDSNPIFFRGTLLSNLTFGVRAGQSDDSSIERVQKICMKIGVPKDLVDLVQDDPQQNELRWSKLLSDVEMRLLCLARALVANPEVLCLDKPMQGFSEKMQRKVLKALKEDFVVERGMVQDPSQKSRRRPRTCIFTQNSNPGFKYVDDIFEVSRETGIKQIVDAGTL